MKHYDNPQCHSVSEFGEDLNRFIHLKRLFVRHLDGDTKEKLILNHIIILYNLFGDGLNDMLFYKVEKEYWGVMLPFMILLNRAPEDITDIPLDNSIVEALRKI